ncbi:DUF3995 domain-containing protein [Neoaquamicrobium sediminum]|uniref:DUF3995 domain-containing protein n=1 Tax=Neoaquamicrobium sediminum TaxID=1849104 RepID=A0ABV3WNE1_9HYPH
MTLVATLVALVLVLLAALHVYWGLGGVWPGTDQKSCARAIAGFKGIDRMPSPPAAFSVAAALAVAALIALALAGIVTLPLPAALIRLGGLGAALVFLGRGIAGFTPAWRRITPEMPFARNDRLYFSPLCLLIGAGFTLLLFQGVAT